MDKGNSTSKIGIDSLFPKEGDLRRAPQWIIHSLILIMLAGFVFLFILNIWEKASTILIITMLAVFFSLALEPVVLWLKTKGIKTNIGSAICVLSILLLIIIMITLLGNLFITQLSQLFLNIPTLYSELKEWVTSQFGFELPRASDLAIQVFDQWGKNISTTAISMGFSLFVDIGSFLTIMILVYFFCAYSDKIRRSIIGWFEPKKQINILNLFLLVQKKIAGYLGSRFILALLSIFFTSICLITVKTPYWLPLAIFMGVLSQFIPVVGTYIGGALPVLITLTSGGVIKMIIVLAFLIIYQQIENFFLAPKISADALGINPGLAFFCVIAGASIFGALGAFLALPLTAIAISLVETFGKKYAVEEINLSNTQSRESKQQK